jgi:hypothetical protein
VAFGSGISLAAGHIIAASGCFLTLIGIPFGLQHLTLAALALETIGQTIVRGEAAQAARDNSPHENQFADALCREGQSQGPGSPLGFGAQGLVRCGRG